MFDGTARSWGIDDGGEPIDTVTYYQHVKPIIDAKCANCHYDGGVAPFSLTSWA